MALPSSGFEMDKAVPPSDRDRQNPQYDARRIRDDAPGGVYYKGDGVFAVITAHKQGKKDLSFGKDLEEVHFTFVLTANSFRPNKI